MRFVFVVVIVCFVVFFCYIVELLFFRLLLVRKTSVGSLFGVLPVSVKQLSSGNTRHVGILAFGSPNQGQEEQFLPHETPDISAGYKGL